MPFTCNPLTSERWPDLETIFNAKGCSMARGCWCMYYRRTGSPNHGLPSAEQAQRNRAALKKLVASGDPPGLIGYRDGVPVGWASLGPREKYARLQRSPVMKPVDDQPAWSIVCFVVPAPHRGQGVARALLAGAIKYARQQGATLLEAYPVDKAERSHAEFIWFGAMTMFAKAGFVEVTRRRPQRPVMRLRLD